MFESKFKIFSIGIVAQNKKVDEDEIFVCPIEITPFINGMLAANPSKETTDGLDKNDLSYTASVTIDNSVVATWYKGAHSNRRTSPDVRRGERVMIYRYADSDKFYWDTMGMDDHLRKLETVVWSWSDTQDESKDSTDPENSYSLEVCTRTGQMTLRTAKANGEPFAYIFQFNTKEGAVVLTDDDDNWIELNSRERKITLENKDKTHVILDKKDLSMYAPNDINMECDNDFNIKVGNNFTLDVKENTNVTSGSMIKLKVGKSEAVMTPSDVTVSTGRVNLKKV